MDREQVGRKQAGSVNENSRAGSNRLPGRQNNTIIRLVAAEKVLYLRHSIFPVQAITFLDNVGQLIKIAPGNAQATKPNSASIGPPNLSPKTVIVWVVDGPGSKLQKAFTSFSVS